MKDKTIRLRKWIKIAGSFFVSGLVLFVALVVYANLLAKRAGEGVLFDDVEQVPPQAVGLVFGTSYHGRSGQGENPYFTNRIDAAVELWQAGKVECLLVSGDNSERFYNEPQKMREALIERGVPADKVVRDFAGFRTLDTIVRAQEVFQASSVVLVSQKFHNERAAYLARQQGLDFVGYNAKDVQTRAPVSLREVGARVLMWLDVRILKTSPRHLGKMEYLPIEGHPLASSPELVSEGLVSEE